MLLNRGYDSDPVKAWKESQDKLRVSVMKIQIFKGLVLIITKMRKR